MGWSSRKQTAETQKVTQVCFPIIKGEVNGTLNDGKPFTIKIHEGLFICRAGEVKPGFFVHELCGQPQKYLAERIYINTYEQELTDARKATVRFLTQIDEWIQENGEINGYLETIFGLYYLSWLKPSKPKAQESDF